MPRLPPRRRSWNRQSRTERETRRYNADFWRSDSRRLSPCPWSELRVIHGCLCGGRRWWDEFLLSDTFYTPPGLNGCFPSKKYCCFMKNSTFLFMNNTEKSMNFFHPGDFSLECFSFRSVLQRKKAAKNLKTKTAWQRKISARQFF